MNRRLALLALVTLSAPLALTACDADQERSFFLHVVFFCFGMGAGVFSLAGSAIALVRVARKQARSYVNLAISVPFATTTVFLHALATDGFSRAIRGFDLNSLWLVLMTGAPLFWLAATVIEVSFSPPPLPPGVTPEELPFKPVSPEKVAFTLLPLIAALAVYFGVVVAALNRHR